MDKKKFKISKKKLDQAINYLILGELNYSAIAQKVGISRQTLLAIRKDEDVQNRINETARHNLSTGVAKASQTVITLLNAKSEKVRLDAATYILSLANIQPNENLIVDVKQNVGMLNQILLQMEEKE
ncbi:hypothetical protein [uncultured Gemella sp.]|uniref:hypothetical protein n=1 Tax=uncultured Gemella sp. TaxID=254352 RepID=UPI0026160BB8|nr:hypothetical protein [uncultured Gemella sp.]